MDAKTLALFVETARLGSFAAVARAHDLDPSSVSRTVAALEADLGVRLFQRTTRRLSLTEAGAVYLRRVEPLVEELERAGDEARTLSAVPGGTLRLTCSVAFGHELVIPLLPAFRAAYPRIALDLLMTDANVDLVAERVDLAIRLAAAIEADVIGTKLLDSRYRVCASPAYLAKREKPRTPSELSDHDCLLFPLPEFRSRWRFRDRAGRVGAVPVHGDIIISNALALKRAALAGLGPALLADWMIRGDMAAGRLIDLFPDHDVAATSFDAGAWLLYPSRAFLPGKVRVTIDFLRRRLGR